jgi:mannan endo-1,4-beta-mannosidase
MARELTEGFVGDDVGFVQRRLNESPPTGLAPLSVDGDFGPITDARVREYQANTSLPIDGLVGPVTWKQLIGRSVRTTTGFFVLGRGLYDREGVKVLLRGVNKMSVFEYDGPEGEKSFPAIKQTGANSVRIVWRTWTSEEPAGTTPARLDALIRNAKKHHLIPMIELHDATGNWSGLPDLIAYWLRPDVLPVLAGHEQYLLLNIGNEVGDDTVTVSDFVIGYTTAVRDLRAAGVHMPLVIDAPDSGKNLALLNRAAGDLLSADPDGNLLFSVHPYWSMLCGHTGARISSDLKQAADLDYPLVVGEFSRWGAWPWCAPDPAKESICGKYGEVDYRAILAACHELHIGWYAWEWGPGNAIGTPGCEVMDMTTDQTFGNLKQGWATEVAITSPFGISKTAVTPPWV